MLSVGRIQATRHAHRPRLWDVPPKQSGLAAKDVRDRESEVTTRAVCRFGARGEASYGDAWSRAASQTV
jgi:hypothetical protein